MKACERLKPLADIFEEGSVNGTLNIGVCTEFRVLYRGLHENFGTIIDVDVYLYEDDIHSYGCH